MAATRTTGLPVTCSMGVMTFTRPPDSVNEMMAKADALMYEVKNGGKDDFRSAVYP
jgi:PleD family two-component response regulator